MTTTQHPARTPAEHLPVAHVAVDIPLPHLDRPFDYLVSAADSDAVRPGVRVRVRFSGRLVNGFVLGRSATSEHTGQLAFLHRVVSDEVVLTDAVAQLCRAVADRYAGSLADVLRLAVPPRHAATEKKLGGAPVTGGPGGGAAAGADAWADYQAGPALLSAIAAGKPARAVWSIRPGDDWCARLVDAALTARSAGRGALLLVPDRRDLDRLAAALAQRVPSDDYVTLSADAGPAKRYREFLRVSRSEVHIVAGTRAAAFAPVSNVGLVALFDDGDDSFREPRAPYPHAREVAMLRSAQEGAALVLAGYTRTAEAQMLVETGWAHAVVAARDTVRRWSPRIEAAGDDYARGADSAAARARISPAAFAAARDALHAGLPVLIQVPRSGYAPSLACAHCRRPARCRRCSGPLAVVHGARTPSCRWCGVAVPRWTCSVCASTQFRMTVTGAVRTAEEIGRAFPGVRLRTSAGESIVDEVPGTAAIVVATPGAEPVAVGGYGAALLLDGGLMLSRPDLRAGEEAFRRWMSAAALVRSGEDGGRVVVGADVSLPIVQALLRWDPAHHAAAELAARRDLGFPPVSAMVSVEGNESAVGRAIGQLHLPDGAEVLGPVPAGHRPRASDGSTSEPEQRVRALVRVPLERRKELLHALRVLAVSRATRKETEPIRFEVDPVDLG